MLGLRGAGAPPAVSSGDPWSGAEWPWGAPLVGGAGRVLPSCGAGLQGASLVGGAYFRGGAAPLVGGAGGVLPTCGRGFRAAAPLVGGSSGCCPLAGAELVGRRLQLFRLGAP